MDATGAIIRQIGLESYGNTWRFRKVVLAIAITCCVDLEVEEEIRNDL